MSIFDLLLSKTLEIYNVLVRVLVTIDSGLKVVALVFLIIIFRTKRSKYRCLLVNLLSR